jgi:hypothetical protein
MLKLDKYLKINKNVFKFKIKLQINFLKITYNIFLYIVYKIILL